MQHGRDTECLAHRAQAWTSQRRGLRQHLTGLAVGNSRAPGDQHQNIVLDELAGQLDVREVLRQLGVVAPDHRDRAADGAGDDGVDERLGCAAERAEDRLDGEAAHHPHRLDRDADPFLVPVGVGLNCHPHDLAGDLGAAARVE